MKTCCICGNAAEDNAATIWVNRPLPVCASCASVLDTLTDSPAEDLRKKAETELQEKIRLSGAPAAVWEAVKKLKEAGPVEEQERPEDPPTAEPAEEEKKREDTSSFSSTTVSINSLCRFLSGIAVAVLICGVLMSIISGVALARTSGGTGWAIAIGGSLVSVLTFAMIMLVLGVATAVGNIDGRMQTVNEDMVQMKRTLARIADKVAAGKKKD